VFFAAGGERGARGARAVARPEAGDAASDGASSNGRDGAPSSGVASRAGATWSRRSVARSLPSGPLSGAFESLAVMAGFVAFGLGWAVILAP